VQAPPGEPEPGASRVFPGDSGDTTPEAHPAVSGSARAVITGSGTAVGATVRIWARRGMVLNVVPSDSLVYVNEVPIGPAGQFASEAYEFAHEGSYNVKIVAPGYADKTFVVTADPNAKSEVARIDLRLTR
jgi:hypothetical protein